MDNDNDFYMVKFDHSADKEKVITVGPWLIFDHCLVVSHWSPEFALLDPIFHCIVGLRIIRVPMCSCCETSCN
jgi:hypothetical protein